MNIINEKVITEEMINEFNKKILIDFESPIRIIQNKSFTDGTYDITIQDKFIEYVNLNLSDEFYDMLISFFDKKGIIIKFNNTRNTFWRKYISP